jgi:hypothetical protein
MERQSDYQLEHYGEGVIMADRKYPYTDSNGFIWHDPDCYTDDVGGHHDSGIGWNPNGHWCGECNITSCRDCPNKYILNEDDEDDD